ncbi:MAG: hypothetical protein ACOZNI_15005 [Myxococcota bacterium]
MILASLAAAATVDATRVLVLSTPEMTAMGGAGIGFATGADGLLFQPAAPANRKIESRARFAGDLVFNRLGLGLGEATDLGNLGGGNGWRGTMNNLGLAGLYRNFGMGASFARLAYQRGEQGVTVYEGHLAGAGNLLDGHLVLGTGYRILQLVAVTGDDDVIFEGAGLETGVLVNRVWDGMNFGGVLRLPVTAEPLGSTDGLRVAAVDVPWEASFAVAWGEFEMIRPTRVAADLVIAGPVDDGLSLEALMADQTVARGAKATLSPRLGVETGLWPGRLKWRVGAYLEPSRTDVRPARLHGTTGFELKLFHLKALGLVDHDLAWKTSVDAARGYVNFGWIGLGLWQRGEVGVDYDPPAPPS